LTVVGNDGEKEAKGFQEGGACCRIQSSGMFDFNPFPCQSDKPKIQDWKEMHISVNRRATASLRLGTTPAGGSHRRPCLPQELNRLCTHSPEFKARAAREAISGCKTIHEIADDHSI
jgi:hypothetical protein